MLCEHVSILRLDVIYRQGKQLKFPESVSSFSK